jgi:hypothetical protein
MASRIRLTLSSGEGRTAGIHIKGIKIFCVALIAISGLDSCMIFRGTWVKSGARSCLRDQLAQTKSNGGDPSCDFSGLMVEINGTDTRNNRKNWSPLPP